MRDSRAARAASICAARVPTRVESLRSTTNRAMSGRVSRVSRGFAQVTLVTDESFATGVKVLGSGQQSSIEANPNRPGELQLRFVQNPNRVHRGDAVVTAGSEDVELRSFYPRGVLIGRVSKIEAGEGNLDTRIEVKPAVDLGTLEWVEVLTRAQQPQTVASTGTATP